MMRLSILLQNEIEIANVAVEIFLIFLYFSLLCKRKIKKISLLLFFLLFTGILSTIVLLSDSIVLNLATTTILISITAFLCFDDTIRHKIFWIVIYLLIISIS